MALPASFPSPSGWALQGLHGTGRGPEPEGVCWVRSVPPSWGRAAEPLPPGTGRVKTL